MSTRFFRDTRRNGCFVLCALFIAFVFFAACGGDLEGTEGFGVDESRIDTGPALDKADSLFGGEHFVSLDWYISAESVQALGVDLSSVSPPVNTHVNAGAYLHPAGALGYFGPIGPLGPVGSHGYAADGDGSFLDSDGLEVRSIEVPWSGDCSEFVRKNDACITRVYELYEHYSERYAKLKADNDTSFMVSGSISVFYWEKDQYEFTSEHDQFVTILLVPEYQLDTFELVLRDKSGTVIAQSRTSNMVEWIQLYVDAGTTLTAEVNLSLSGHFLSQKKYRLFVTGSTAYYNVTDISGEHQVPRL